MAAEILDTTTMLANSYEIKRSYRWLLEIDGIDAFTLVSTSRPKGTFGEIEIDWLNSKRFEAGKWTWSEMEITLNDPIAPSAAQKVMDWVRLCYEHETGRAGYSAFYKKDIRLKLLDGPGAVVEQWLIKSAWIKGLSDMGTLDYKAEEPVKITCALRFDSAILQF